MGSRVECWPLTCRCFVLALYIVTDCVLCIHSTCPCFRNTSRLSTYISLHMQICKLTDPTYFIDFIGRESRRLAEEPRQVTLAATIRQNQNQTQNQTQTQTQSRLSIPQHRWVERPGILSIPADQSEAPSSGDKTIHKLMLQAAADRSGGSAAQKKRSTRHVIIITAHNRNRCRCHSW